MNHQVILGDCLEVFKDIKSDSIDGIVTDPPYGYLNHKIEKAFDYDEFFKECYRVLKKDKFLVFFGMKESYFKMSLSALDAGFKFKEQLIWSKNGCSSCPLVAIRRTHENISIFCKGEKGLNRIKINTIEQRHDESLKRGVKTLLSELSKIKTIEELDNFRNLDLYSDSADCKAHHGTFAGVIGAKQYTKKTTRKGKEQYTTLSIGASPESILVCSPERSKIHPTAKPTKLIELILPLFSSENDLILDPFAGIGRIAKACQKLNRSSISIEIEEEYYLEAKQALDI